MSINQGKSWVRHIIAQTAGGRLIDTYDSQAIRGLELDWCVIDEYLTHLAPISEADIMAARRYWLPEVSRVNIPGYFYDDVMTISESAWKALVARQMREDGIQYMALEQSTAQLQRRMLNAIWRSEAR